MDKGVGFMHRVDSAGTLARLTQLRCVVRRTYSVQGPLHLVHKDANHKLIRSDSYIIHLTINSIVRLQISFYKYIIQTHTHTQGYRVL